MTAVSGSTVSQATSPEVKWVAQRHQNTVNSWQYYFKYNQKTYLCTCTTYDVQGLSCTFLLVHRHISIEVVHGHDILLRGYFYKNIPSVFNHEGSRNAC